VGVESQSGPGNLPLGLTLRPFEERDIDALVAWGRDDELCRAAEWTEGLPDDDLRAQWRTMIASPDDVLIRRAIALGDRVIGYADLYGHAPDQRELGIVIGERSSWGRGLGRLGAARMLDYGFDCLGLATVVAQAWDANRRSVRLLQHLGMRETGRGAEGYYRDAPSWYRQFEIARAEWQRGRAAFLDAR
jgi:RimJ/RimL family protein N-acetyltransferase